MLKIIIRYYYHTLELFAYHLVVPWLHCDHKLLGYV